MRQTRPDPYVARKEKGPVAIKLRALCLFGCGGRT